MDKARPVLLRCGAILNVLGLLGLVLVLAEHGGRGFSAGAFGAEFLQGLKAEWVVLLVMGCLLTMAGNGSEPVGRWSRLFDGIAFESREFYTRLFRNVSARELRRVSQRTVSNPSGGFIYSNRLYARIRLRSVYFDLCVSPVGTGTGVSWRCYHRLYFLERALTALPVLGWLIYYAAYRYTPYSEDQASLLQASIQAAVAQTIEETCDEQGVELPAEIDFAPVFADLFNRW